MNLNQEVEVDIENIKKQRMMIEEINIKIKKVAKINKKEKILKIKIEKEIKLKDALNLLLKIKIKNWMN
jgi:hypothetical protein